MDDKCNCTFTYTLAAWLLRFWLGTRGVITGLVKFYGDKKTLTAEALELKKEDPAGFAEMLSAPGSDAFYEVTKGFGFSAYKAMPADGIPMSVAGFKANPLMPSFMVEPYAWVLGPALVLTGLALIFGFCSRLTLFVSGLLYISLTYGFLILEKQLLPADCTLGVASLAVHMLLIVAALMLSDYNKLQLLDDKKICKLLCKNK